MAKEFYSSSKRSSDNVEPLYVKDKKKEHFFKPVNSISSPLKPTPELIQKKEQKEGNLPDAIQTKMEKSFGEDFSKIRIHLNSGPAADLNAIAYTQGNDIRFAPGYDPYSLQGQEYLGHELSHVIQQRAGIVKTTHRESGFHVNSDKTLENQADEAGKKAAGGKTVNFGFDSPSTSNFSSVQKKDAPIQLLRQPIPNAAFILDVNTTADIVLQDLIHVASITMPDYTDVNWRQIFFPAIEGQIRGKTLGSISHAWTDTEYIDTDWQVNISFSLDNAVPTGRTESRQVVSSQGGASSPSLGSSQTVTTGQTASVQGSVTNAPGGVGTGGSVTLGTNDSTARGQLQGTAGSITGGQTQTSAESISRFRANLFTTIQVRSTTGYSNWDIINPAKWGAHLADLSNNREATRTLQIGTITYDRPNF